MYTSPDYTSVKRKNTGTTSYDTELRVYVRKYVYVDKKAKKECAVLKISALKYDK